MTREEYINFANCLKNNYTIDFDVLPEFCDMAISAVKWIPVSERLPKDDENVLVYCGQFSGQGVMNIAYYHNDYTFYPSEYADLNETGWYDENDDAIYHEPIAWMPLPEPYKGGDV